ncbi:MAG: hypothetical protein F4013_05860 [Gammaproteobacteria bacterium]|nr:hypothetical protein [Gammaproteobacteria bacterium]
MIENYGPLAGLTDGGSWFDLPIFFAGVYLTNKLLSWSKREKVERSHYPTLCLVALLALGAVSVGAAQEPSLSPEEKAELEALLADIQHEISTRKKIFQEADEHVFRPCIIYAYGDGLFAGLVDDGDGAFEFYKIAYKERLDEGRENVYQAVVAMNAEGSSAIALSDRKLIYAALKEACIVGFVSKGYERFKGEPEER